MFRDFVTLIRTVNQALAGSFKLFGETRGEKRFLFFISIYFWFRYAVTGAVTFWALSMLYGPVFLTLVVFALGVVYVRLNLKFQRWFANKITGGADYFGSNTFFVRDLVFLTVDSTIPVFLISGPVYYVLAKWLDLSFILG